MRYGVRRYLPAVLFIALTFVSVNTNAQSVKVLVKLNSTLAKEVEAALPMATMSVSQGHSGSSRVDAFMRAHSAKKLSPLYQDIVRGKKRGLSDLQIASAIQRKFRNRSSRLRTTFNPPEISRTYIVEIDSSADLSRVLRQLNADTAVEYAEPDHVVRVRDLPNDPYLSSSSSWGQAYDDLWGIKRIGAPAAWSINGGDGVVVAVVDTGIDYNHPDIAANIWTNPNEVSGNGLDDDNNGFIDDIRGWDFIGSSYQFPTQSNNPMDGFGHGTHVAGTIAAVGNNGIGVVGVAWRSKVMPVKALDNQGSGLDSTLAPAIIYAANNGADVISNSWTGIGYSQTIADAVAYAYNLGAVVVAAAGNNNDDVSNYYPANLPQVITVAAVDPTGAKASFSNFGSKIDVAAPGVDILSLRAANTNMGTPVGTAYTRADGTSMATPHVSGTAALIVSQHPEYSNEQVRQVLRVSGGQPSGTIDLNFGYGVVNANAALASSSVLEAKIQSPYNGTTATSSITITGIARGTGFASYTLEYGEGSEPSIWILIQNGNVPVNGGPLGAFDPMPLTNGVYTIRLTAYDAANSAFVDRIQLTAQAISISSPATPKVPTTALVTKPGQLNISGTAVGENFQSYSLQWAPGIAPNDGWTSTGMSLAGGGSTPIIKGLLGNWDNSSINQAGYYTIRLTVQASGYTSHTDTLVYIEPSLVASGWPVWLDQAPQVFTAGMVPATDSSGNVRLTMENPAFMNTNIPARFWTFGIDGSVLLKSDLYYASYFQPAAGDLDGIAGEEVILPEAQSLRWFAADGTSSVVSAPAPTPSINFQYAQLVMEDLDGDSKLETLGLGSYWPAQTAYLFAWRPEGTQLNSNFPIPIVDQNTGLSPGANSQRVLVGDLYGDGKKEIIVVEGTSTSTFSLRLFQSDGTPRAWSVPTFTGAPHKIMLADLDRNGMLETIVVWSNGAQEIVDVRQPDGSQRPGWPVMIGPATFTYAALGDLNRDGNLEIVAAASNRMYVFKADGTQLSSAWPKIDGPYNGYGSVAIADIDGDGFPEILTVRNELMSFSGPLFSSTSASSPKSQTDGVTVTQTSPLLNSGGIPASASIQTVLAQDVSTTSYFAPQLMAIRSDGTVARSWNLLGANNNQPYGLGQATVGDFNNDGITDIAVVYWTVSGGGTSGYLSEGVATVLTTGTPTMTTPNDWPMVYQNARNTSIAHVYDPVPPSVSIVAPTDGSTVSGVTFVSTNATDNVHVVGVQLKLDGANLGPEIGTSPFQYAWDTRTSSPGTHSLTAVARDGSGNTATSTPISVTILPPIGIVANPGSFAFGGQVINTTSAAKTITLTNNSAQSITPVITTTADFAQSNNCVVLAQGDTCSASVTFTPATRGNENGTLTVSANGTAPLLVTLTGTGQLLSSSVSPTSIDFLNQPIGTTSLAHPVWYSNTGDVPVPLASISTTGDFIQTNSCGTSVAVGAVCIISVSFKPSIRGAETGSLVISGGASASVALVGNGQVMTGSFSPSSLTFANQNVSTTSAPQSVTVTNTGDVAFSLGSWSVGGSFSAVSHCPLSIAPGTNCTFDVTFTPTQFGNQTGTLRLFSTLPTSPAVIALAGNGAIAPPVFTPASVNFGGQILNTTSAQQPVVLTNSSTAAISITRISIAGDFAQTNNCGFTLGVGGSCTINVTFTPKTRGSETGTLSVTGQFTGGSTSAQLNGTGQLITLTPAPTAIVFAGQVVNTTSAAHTVTFTNTGDVAFPVLSIQVSGPFGQTSSCGTSIAVGASCAVSVTFTPTARGAANGTLFVVGGGSTNSVPLTGTGQILAATLTPSSTDFSGQQLNTTSAPRALTYTNTGDLPISISSVNTSGDFAQVNNCPATLAVGTACTVNVTFTPTLRGAETGAVSVSGSGAATAALTGAGQLLSVSITPTTVSFGNQLVNTTSGPQTVTVLNNGDISFLITGWSSPAAFPTTTTCGASLSAGSSCTFTITFSPTSPGGVSNVLTIQGAFPGSPAKINLSGTGVVPLAGLSTTSLNFGSQRVNTSSSGQIVTLTNIGGATLSINGWTVSGDYTQNNNCGTTLAANASCTVTIVFTPTTRGLRTGSLALSSNSSGSVPSVSLTGTGTAPVATLSTSSLTFANQNVNTASGAQNVTLTNTGDAALNISNIVASGDFSQSNNCTAQLAPNASCAISVTFNPSSGGNRAATLNISDDSFLGSPQTVPLNGTAADYSLSTTVTSFSLSAGQSASTSVKVIDVGGPFNSAVSLQCSGLPSLATCSFTPVSVTPGSTSATSNLKITTGKRTPLGTYAITIIGTSAPTQRSTIMSLTVK